MEALSLIATLAGVLGAVSIAFEVIRRTSRWTGTQRLLRFRFREPVDVVMPKPKNVDLDPTQSPYEGVLTNLGNLKSSVAITAAVDGFRSGKEVAVHIAQALDGENGTALNRDLVLFGGYRGNPVSGRFLKRLSETVGDQVSYLDDDPERNQIRVGDKTVEYDWVTEAGDRAPRLDYSLLVVWMNPFTSEPRRGILSVGFTSYGTYAGVRYLLGDFFNERVRRMRPTLTAASGSEPASLRPRPTNWRPWPSFALLLRSEFQNGHLIDSRELSFLQLPKPASARTSS